MNLSVRRAVRTALALSAASALGLALSAHAQEQVPPPPPPPELVEPEARQAAAPLEEVIVEGRQQSAAEAVIEERINQEVVADIVSSEQISRVGDSSVSLALRRLPAVTVVGDQYIYVRGLGERYSSTTLNGAYVPSPDLTRNVIPLDLFPAEIVDTLSVQKGYSPDKPAAFGGGSVDIRTRGIPDRLVLDFEVGTGWNTDSDDDGLTYPGGDDDKWGTDDGTRELPAAITTAINDFQGDLSPAGIFNALNRDGEFHTIGEAQQINREIATSLNRNLDFQEKSLDPDLSVEGVVGNSWTVDEAGDWTIGALALADYENTWRNRERINRSASFPDTDIDRTQRTTNQVTLTGSLAFGIDYADEHEVQATGIFLRNTDDDASLTLGNNPNFQQPAGQQLRNYRIRYEERELEVLQFHGRHTLGPETLELLDFVPMLSTIEGLNVNWYYSDATATTDIPNEVLFSAVDSVVPETGEVLSTSIRSSVSAADFRFTDLEDSVTSYGVGVTLPMQLGDVLVEPGGGYDYTEKARSYLQTQLGLGTTAPAAVPALVGSPGQVFIDENILDPDNDFVLSLGGIGTESYLAGETVDAAWGKLDVTWNDTWRVAAGARWEDFSQLSVPVDQYQFDPDVGKIPVPADQFEALAKNEDDYYPAAAVTWMRRDFWAERFQLRLGWSETTARPDLREISDATFIDPLTEARVTGNPNLEPADLANFDIRAEWFFESGDNFTASLFYKDIESPIETIESSGTDDNISLTFVNADSAEIYGVEVEWLKGLGFIASESTWADAFFVSGNVTWSESEITIGDVALNLTNNVREMSQHSPWVVNLQLGFDAPNQRHSASLAYNAFGERLFFAGVNGAPDAFEQPFHSLDLIYSYYPTEAMTIKLRLQNLLDEQLEIEQGGVTVLEQTVGSVVKLDLSYRF
jgi:outer membrane receptor protein involved in Fe transport